MHSSWYFCITVRKVLIAHGTWCQRNSVSAQTQCRMVHGALRQLWLSQARVPDAVKTALLDVPISPGHTFGPAVEEILQKSHWKCEASRQLATFSHPPRAPAWGRAHQQRTTGPTRKAERMQDVASPHTSVPGGVSSANALDSHPKLPHHNLSSPSRAPEGWRPQTPFRHNRQYWHACTSDTWVLATVQNGYVLQFRLGPPPFRGSQNMGTFSRLDDLVAAWEDPALSANLPVTNCDDVSGEEHTKEDRVDEID
ncbi:UNVERIFIED_CONTAM: hypothetical protein FKN15_050568 [Acipenser sinensis]